MPRSVRRKQVAPARTAWGETSPFEGLVPGLVRPGELAAELERVVRGRAASAGPDPEDRAQWIDEAMTPGAVMCRDALPEPDQIAFDAATLVIAELYAPEAVGPRALALCRAWRSSEPALRAIGGIAQMLGAWDAVNLVRRRLGEPPRASEFITTLEGRLEPDFSLLEGLLEQAFGPDNDRPR